MKMRFQLHREQRLSISLEEAWDFFSSPINLEKITPSYMKFKIKSTDLPLKIHEGMEINYTVCPLLGIPLKWKTRITEVENMKKFTDIQEKGPFKYWKHTHEFKETPEGILMFDTIEYELPFGFLGLWAHSIQVKNQLEGIFEFRKNFIDQHFRQL